MIPDLCQILASWWETRDITHSTFITLFCLCLSFLCLTVSDSKKRCLTHLKSASETPLYKTVIHTVFITDLFIYSNNHRYLLEHLQEFSDPHNPNMTEDPLNSGCLTQSYNLQVKKWLRQTDKRSAWCCCCAVQFLITQWDCLTRSKVFMWGAPWDGWRTATTEGGGRPPCGRGGELRSAAPQLESRPPAEQPGSEQTETKTDVSTALMKFGCGNIKKCQTFELTQNFNNVCCTRLIDIHPSISQLLTIFSWSNCQLFVL